MDKTFFRNFRSYHTSLRKALLGQIEGGRSYQLPRKQRFLKVINISVLTIRVGRLVLHQLAPGSFVGNFSCFPPGPTAHHDRNSCQPCVLQGDSKKLPEQIHRLSASKDAASCRYYFGERGGGHQSLLEALVRRHHSLDRVALARIANNVILLLQMRSDHTEG